MKNLTTAVFLIALTHACSEEAQQSAEAHASDVKEEVAETWDDLSAYSYERRSEFAEALEDRMEDAEERLAELRSRASEEADEARGAIEDKIADLAEIKDELAAKVDELGDASANGWEELRDGAIEAFEAFQETLESATDSVG